MMLKSIFIVISVMMFRPCIAQEIVKVLQPAMYTDLLAGQSLSDSVFRYYLNSKESAYLSNGMTYVADFDIVNSTESYKTLLDTSGGQWNPISGTYEFFFLDLDNGNAIIGSNGFECDITLTNLAYVTREGNLLWLLNYETLYPINVIDSIGFVEPDVIAVTGDNTVKYFDLEGSESFYEQPPLIYYNVIEHNGFYYGTRQHGVYKLNNLFEPIENYPIYQPLYLQYVGSDGFIVSTQHLTFLLNAELKEVSVNFQIDSTLSVASTSEYFWIVTPKGLFQTTKSLVVQKHYPQNALENMLFTWAHRDTVFVGSEYNGIRHKDIVIRKYGPGITSTEHYDATISSLYIDTVIRVQLPGEFGYRFRFDSVIIGIQNIGLDTITSFNINWDWRLNLAFCSSIWGEQHFEGISIPPGHSLEVQLTQILTNQFSAHIENDFCFWVDFPDRNIDVFPIDNVACFAAEIVSGIEDPLNRNLAFIYPNPSSDYITIQVGEKVIGQVDVYSSQGVLMHSTSSSGGELQLDISNWSAGVYFIVANTNGKLSQCRFIKQ